jgi:hypothetical protein
MNEVNIHPIFNALGPSDVLGIYDYIIPGPLFDYVDEQVVGLTVADAIELQGDGFLGSFARPILTPLNILDMFQSRVCVCTFKKEPTRSHCSPCYFSLPKEQQTDLYQRFRQGYEQAFLRSLITLIKNGRTTIDRILAAVPKPKGD